MNIKKCLLILIVLALVGVLGFLCFNYAKAVTDKKENPVVSMEIEGYGTIEIELYPDVAPNTVKNFIKLAENGFYDGKTFSEVGESYVKGGYDLTKNDDTETESTDDVTLVGNSDEDTTENLVGPKLSDIRDLKDGEEDNTYAIEGEFADNGYNDNRLSHERGIVSMARADYTEYQEEIAMMQMLGDSYGSTLDMILERMNDSATSGFFIMTDNDTSYNGTYAAFGKVISGMDVVDKISEIELSEDDTTNQPVIKSVKVDKKGAKYDAPETIETFDFDSIFNLFLSNFASAQ